MHLACCPAMSAILSMPLYVKSWKVRCLPNVAPMMLTTYRGKLCWISWLPSFVVVGANGLYTRNLPHKCSYEWLQKSVLKPGHLSNAANSAHTTIQMLIWGRHATYRLILIIAKITTGPTCIFFICKAGMKCTLSCLCITCNSPGNRVTENEILPPIWLKTS